MTTVDLPDLPGSSRRIRDDRDTRNTILNQDEAVVAKERENQNGSEKKDGYVMDQMEDADAVDSMKQGESMVDNGEGSMKQDAEFVSSNSKVNTENEIPVASNADIEEEQIIEEWEDVMSGKTNRSPTKRILKYGQVKLLTPSRFLVLNEVNDNGELINQTEKQDEIEKAKEIVLEKETTDAEHKMEDRKREEEIIEGVTRSVDGKKEDGFRSETVTIEENLRREEGSKTEEGKHETENKGG
ncbi:hypothetical protein Bca101_060063 [Brassica carinata]